MNRDLEHFLAMVTVAMPIILAGAHMLRALAVRIREHALTTESKYDDQIAARLFTFAMWLDVIVVFVAKAASGGLARTSEATPADGGDQ
jgi:hypothetical protein